MSGMAYGALASVAGDHDLLSTVHTDTVEADPVLGDVVTAQAQTPSGVAWERLARPSVASVLSHAGTASEVAWKAETALSSDGKIKISSNDTTPGYLNPKLVTSSGLGFTEENQGANEDYLIYAIQNRQAAFVFAKTLIAETHPAVWRYRGANNMTITRIDLNCGTAPVGAAILVDVHKNGTTIHTTQSKRATIADGQTSGTTTDIEVTDLDDNDVLTVIIDQIGSGTAGEDLTVTIHVKYVPA